MPFKRTIGCGCQCSGGGCGSIDWEWNGYVWNYYPTNVDPVIPDGAQFNYPSTNGSTVGDLTTTDNICECSIPACTFPLVGIRASSFVTNKPFGQPNRLVYQLQAADVRPKAQLTCVYPENLELFGSGLRYEWRFQVHYDSDTGLYRMISIPLQGIGYPLDFNTLLSPWQSLVRCGGTFSLSDGQDAYGTIYLDRH